MWGSCLDKRETPSPRPSKSLFHTVSSSSSARGHSAAISTGPLSVRFTAERMQTPQTVVGRVSLPQLTARETEAQRDELSSPQQILVCSSLHLDLRPLLVNCQSDIA